MNLPFKLLTYNYNNSKNKSHESVWWTAMLIYLGVQNHITNTYKHLSLFHTFFLFFFLCPIMANANTLRILRPTNELYIINFGRGNTCRFTLDTKKAYIENICLEWKINCRPTSYLFKLFRVHKFAVLHKWLTMYLTSRLLCIVYMSVGLKYSKCSSMT